MSDPLKSALVSPCSLSLVRLDVSRHSGQHVMPLCGQAVQATELYMARPGRSIMWLHCY